MTKALFLETYKIVHYTDYKYQQDYLMYLKANKLFALNQLTGEARLNALSQVYESQQWWVNKYYQDIRDYIAEFGIHKFINKNKRFNLTKSISKTLKLNKRLRTDPKYFEGFTLNNLQEFDSEGNRFDHYPMFRKPTYRTIEWN